MTKASASSTVYLREKVMAPKDENADDVTDIDVSITNGDMAKFVTDIRAGC